MRVVAVGVVILAVSLTLVVLAASHPSRRPAITIPTFHSPSRPALVTFGHSFVAGGSPVPVRPTWTVRAARKLHLAPDDRGVDGALSNQVLTVVDDYKVRSEDEVVIEGEINDVLSGLGARHFAHDLNLTLEHLEDGPVRPKKVLVLFDPPSLGWLHRSDDPDPQDKGSALTLARYTAAGKKVVAGYPGVMERDLADGWNPERLENHVDMLHPNKLGVKRIAHVVISALRGTPARGVSGVKGVRR
jgi:hypothetical protein